ncbi:MAG: hypothetical protein ABIN36_14865 [Ferruginibacter sp.]
MKDGSGPGEKAFAGNTGDLNNFNPYDNNSMRNTPCVYQKIATQKQAASRLRMASAVLYARNIVADPQLKELYGRMAANQCSAYSLAVSEYLLMMEKGQWIF